MSLDLQIGSSDPTAGAPYLAPRTDFEDRERQTRMVFGLTPREPLPVVNREALSVYRDYLAARLSFPFRAWYYEEAGNRRVARREVIVLGLADTAAGGVETLSGVLAEARLAGVKTGIPLAELEVAEESPCFPIIEDYWYWFWNWRPAPRRSLPCR